MSIFVRLGLSPVNNFSSKINSMHIPSLFTQALMGKPDNKLAIVG